MSHVVVAHEKHEPRYLAAVAAPFGRRKTEIWVLPLHLCIKLIRERLERGYYFDTDHTTATMILQEIHHPPSDGQDETHRRAWKFLESRDDAEYERLEVVEVEE